MLSDFEIPNGAHPTDRKAWLRWALLCDGVRQEEGGKRLIIGAYRQSVVVNTVPSILSLRMVGAFEFVVAGAHKLEFRVTTPNTQGLGEIETTVEAEAGSFADFDVPVMDLVEAVGGTINLDWRVDGDPWGPPMIWRIEISPDARQASPEEAEALAEFWNSNTQRLGQS